MKKSSFIAVSCLAAALCACGTDTEHNKYGSVDVTSSAPTIEKGFTTNDGWAVKYDHFLVTMSSITIAAKDTQVVTASATSRIFDAIGPAPQALLSATVRFAQPWDSFVFQIGPAVDSEDAPIGLADNVTEEQRDAMTMGGFSIYIEGKATKGAVTKTIKWGFTTDTTFADCEGESNGRTFPGVDIPQDGTDSVDLVLRGDVLFSDDLANPGKTLRFDRIADADADANGEVTVDELTATTLDVARAKNGGAYTTGDEKDVADLGGFTAALSRQILASYRAKGTCKVAPTEAAP